MLLCGVTLCVGKSYTSPYSLSMLHCFPTVAKVLSHSVLHTLCKKNLSPRTDRSIPDAEQLPDCRRTSRGLLGVDVHVLRVSQQANPLLLLPLLRHLLFELGKLAREVGHQFHGGLQLLL